MAVSGVRAVVAFLSTASKVATVRNVILVRISPDRLIFSEQLEDGFGVYGALGQFEWMLEILIHGIVSFASMQGPIMTCVFQEFKSLGGLLNLGVGQAESCRGGEDIHASFRHAEMMLSLKL